MTIVEVPVSAPDTDRRDAQEREDRARVLEAAALEIEVRGWARLKDCDDEGRVCAVGALQFAMGENLPPGTTLGVNGYTAEVSTFGKGESLMEFNDKKALSADEVTFLLRWRASEIRDGL